MDLAAVGMAAGDAAARERADRAVVATATVGQAVEKGPEVKVRTAGTHKAVAEGNVGEG